MKTNCNIKLFIIVFSLCNYVLPSKDSDVETMADALKNIHFTVKVTPLEPALLRHEVSIHIKSDTIINGSTGLTLLAGIGKIVHKNKYNEVSDFYPLVFTAAMSLGMQIFKKYYLNTEPNSEYQHDTKQDLTAINEDNRK